MRAYPMPVQEPGDQVRHLVWDGLFHEGIGLQCGHAEVVADLRPALRVDAQLTGGTPAQSETDTQCRRDPSLREQQGTGALKLRWVASTSCACNAACMSLRLRIDAP